jgi:hypothetical protein
MMAREISEIPGYRGVGLSNRIGAIDQRDIIEFGSAYSFGLYDPEQTGVMQIPFGLRRKTPQFLGPGSTVAQLRNERFGTSNHGGIGAVVSIGPRGQAGVRFPTNTCHSTVPRYPAGYALEVRPIEIQGRRPPLFVLPHRHESCLTGRSYSMIVYRLITN